MKKTSLFLLVAMVGFVASCENQGKEVEVGTLASTMDTFVGQTVTFEGKAVVKETGKFVVYGKDTTAQVFVSANESLMSVVECGKGVEVTGVVTACTQEAGKFYVVATAIEKVCCKKDGKKCCKKDAKKCCKKDSTQNCNHDTVNTTVTLTE